MKNNVLIGVLLFATLCGAPRKTRKDVVQAEASQSTDSRMPVMSAKPKTKPTKSKLSRGKKSSLDRVKSVAQSKTRPPHEDAKKKPSVRRKQTSSPLNPQHRAAKKIQKAVRNHLERRRGEASSVSGGSTPRSTSSRARKLSDVEVRLGEIAQGVM